MEGLGWVSAEDGRHGGPVRTPEEIATAAAQRSAPPSGVRHIAEDITDDELYEAFVEFLGEYGVAREEAPGVIRLDIADDMRPRGLDGREPLMVHLGRAELRRRCWAETNMFDDRDLGADPITDTPVAVGFHTFTFGLRESFESGTGARAGIHPGHLVCEGGELRHHPGPSL